MHFTKTKEDVERLFRALSSDRMSTYHAICGDNHFEILELYNWNIEISAAFYWPLQAVEVGLRNSLHQSLSQKFGDAWYDSGRLTLVSDARRQIKQVKSRLRQDGKPVVPSRVVAELTFGFWEKLLGPGDPSDPILRYEMTLWRTCLYKAFPHARLKRTQAHKPFEYLRTLRNRIAHHEPIFNRHLRADYDSTLRVLSWMTPEGRAWTEHHTRVPKLLDQRPASLRSRHA